MLAFLRVLAIASLVPSCALAHSCNVTDYADVLILGAGMAGVAAARTLHVNGITNYIVLEAYNKIGGRIRRDDAWNIELGANWIHYVDLKLPSCHPLWREWLKCDKNGPGGSETPMDGDMDMQFEMVYDAMGVPYDIRSETGDYRKRNTQFDKSEKRAAKRSGKAALDESVRTALRESGWVRSSSLDNFTEWNDIDYCFGAEPENLSVVLSLPREKLAFVGRNGKPACYLVTDEKGYSFVADCIARDFKNTSRLKLNAKVTKVNVSDDCVCATVQNDDTYCASYAILTFSMGVLQAAVRGDPGAVQFEPELPEDVNQVTMVHFVKIFLKFDVKFWEESKNDQQLIGHVSQMRGYYPVFLMVKSISNTIHVHVTGNQALQVLSQDEATTINDIMVILREIYKNPDIPNPIDIKISEWDNDPLFLGSYEAYGPGVPSNISEILSEPMNNRLYFAGSALSKEHYGYVHGAYESGISVANRVSENMDSRHLSPCAIAGIALGGFAIVILVLVAAYMLGIPDYMKKKCSKKY